MAEYTLVYDDIIKQNGQNQYVFWSGSKGTLCRPPDS